MVDGDALRQIFSITGAAWTSTAILFLLAVRMWNGAPAMLEQWIAYRKAKAEERAAAHSRILEELDRVYEALKVEREENVAKGDKIAFLEADKAKLMQEISALKGYSDGIGRARNEAQRIVSEEREADAKKRGNGK